MTLPSQTLLRLRHLGWLIAGAAVITANVAAAGDAQTTAASANSCTKPFVAPSHPLVLTRTLRHELGAGQELLTRRSYLIQFSPAGAGFRIDGELTGVEVTVPPNLEPIAQLERNRRDEGLFPILVDRQGTITLLPAPARPPLPVTAHQDAGGIIASAALSPAERAEALRFVDALLNARGGVMTQWPSDLFRPASAHQNATTRFPLANGQTGQVTVSLATAAQGACGLLLQFDRTVVTDLGGSQRVSRERWTLVPARP